MPRRLIAPLDIDAVKAHSENLRAMAWAIDRLAAAMKASGVEVVQFDYLRGMLAGIQSGVQFVEYGEQQLEKYLREPIESILANPRPAALEEIQQLQNADPKVIAKWHQLKKAIETLKKVSRQEANLERLR